jgi:flagellar biosynthesis GTPase FlhF
MAAREFSMSPEVGKALCRAYGETVQTLISRGVASKKTLLRGAAAFYVRSSAAGVDMICVRDVVSPGIAIRGSGLDAPSQALLAAFNRIRDKHARPRPPPKKVPASGFVKVAIAAIEDAAPAAIKDAAPAKKAAAKTAPAKKAAAKTAPAKKAAAKGPAGYDTRSMAQVNEDLIESRRKREEMQKKAREERQKRKAEQRAASEKKRKEQKQARIAAAAKAKAERVAALKAKTEKAKADAENAAAARKEREEAESEKWLARVAQSPNVPPGTDDNVDLDI